MMFINLIQLLHVLLFLQSENSNKGSRRRRTQNHNAISKPQLYDCGVDQPHKIGVLEFSKRCSIETVYNNLVLIKNNIFTSTVCAKINSIETETAVMFFSISCVNI